jgi:hypothetical protein
MICIKVNSMQEKRCELREEMHLPIPVVKVIL